MISPFRFWCQKVLPTVYDDSLSYYELLCKVVAKLNEAINQGNTVAEGFEELTKFVNNYFDSTEFTEHIDSKLDEMAINGTLSTIINETIFDELNSKIDASVRTENSNSMSDNIKISVERYMDTTIYITKIKKDGCTVELVPANGSTANAGTNMGTVYGTAKRLKNEVNIVCSSGYGKLYGFSDGTFYENSTYPFADRNPEFYAWIDDENNIQTAQVTQAQNTATYLQSVGAVKNVIPALLCLYIKDGKPTDYPTTTDEWSYDELAPRQILAEDGDNFYLFTILGRMLGQRGIAVPDVREYLATKKLTTAVNLDGGGVVQTIIGGLPICPIMDFYTTSLATEGRTTISAITFKY